eukprot:1697961-Pyramimonas_sp.AAC.1
MALTELLGQDLQLSLEARRVPVRKLDLHVLQDGVNLLEETDLVEIRVRALARPERRPEALMPKSHARPEGGATALMAIMDI